MLEILPADSTQRQSCLEANDPDQPIPTPEACLLDFRKHMDTVVGTGWEETSPVAHLLAMADPVQGARRMDRLTYPVLDGGRNDFVTARKQKNSLLPYVASSGPTDPLGLASKAERILNSDFRGGIYRHWLTGN